MWTNGHNKSLKSLNTFGFDQCAQLYTTAGCEQEIESAVIYAQDNNLALFVLGEGSNIVLANDIAGLVLHLTNDHITIKHTSNDVVEVTAGAGANWHTLVQRTLAADIRGLENLSLIPGSVGAAPVQNIGAYGVEVKMRMSHVKALHIPTMKWLVLEVEDCQFSYRNSIFKQHPDDYIISEVVFTLGNQHALNFAYASLAQHLISRDITAPTAQQISESIIAIRQSKLPDPRLIGNAGSFFHNPVVDANKFQTLLDHYPRIASYSQTNGTVKLAAGWLIDNLGFKGMQRGGVGVHTDQALVLVNNGNGNGAEVLGLAAEIQLAVHEAYGVDLHIEPRVIQ